MDCRRSNCLAGAVSREKQARHFEEEVQFVPAVVDAVVPAAALGRERKTVRCKTKADTGVIEIEVDGITIRAGRGADPTMIASIV
ncbi:mannitol-1-phosphate/altronate dehydrogenase [Bradyrhizobium sp. USDA 4354]